MSLIRELFIPSDAPEGALTKTQLDIERFKILTRGIGMTFGAMSLIYAVVGHVLGTISSIAVLAALCNSACMFSAVATGGIGFIILPLILALGTAAAAGGAFTTPSYPR